MTLKEKQIGYAQIAQSRGLINSQLADKLASCKASYDTVEILFSLIEKNTADEQINTFLARIAR